MLTSSEGKEIDELSYCTVRSLVTVREPVASAKGLKIAPRKTNARLAGGNHLKHFENEDKFGETVPCSTYEPNHICFYSWKQIEKRSRRPS